MRALIVGEQPSGPLGPDGPLAGRCGASLARYAGISLAELLAHSRVNLLGDAEPWDRRRAREVAAALDRWWPRGRPFVLLGGRVAAAFDAVGAPLTWARLASGRRALRVPHPSGLNRLWNDPALRDEALRVLGPLLAR